MEFIGTAKIQKIKREKKKEIKKLKKQVIKYFILTNENIKIILKKKSKNV